MKTAEIRRRFLNFFADKGHTIVESAPLVPANDPTLLFTNSGMVQFKDTFLGFDRRSYDKAVTAQRCLRAGGKHNDLENVGYTARHHTFFEMLGNFSFGDYFKEKAIPYAWEFLTDPAYLGIAKEHLWVTVFGGGDLFKDGNEVPADMEASELWLQTLTAAGFSREEARARIIPIKTTDNFWMMGDSGPCGPCSEIFYDKDARADRFRGEEADYADVCVEIWNLVFMQYNRDAGVLNKLPKPCVDTGMGLERISAVMQGVESNYEIDLFSDLLQAISDLADADRQKKITPSHRVIADHIRSAVFLIADGVLPANDGRGYVLRRIIRRALRHVHKIFPQQQALFYKLVPTLVRLMAEAYPFLHQHQNNIGTILKQEEENFAGLLKNGMTLLAESIKQLPPGERVLPGAVVFKLYDTFGFPPDMTAAIAYDDHQLTVDQAEFEHCMREQRERSRAVTKFNVQQKTVSYDGDASVFIGYEELTAEAQVEAIFVGGEQVREVPEGSNALVMLNQTPFYAESGGQIGDTGTLRSNGASAEVGDTQKIRTDVWGHVVYVNAGCLRQGDRVHCSVDGERRRQITRAHSAAHLMHAALRQVLGDHVQQRGSYVSADSVRFDFSHHGAVKADELRRIEQLVNQQVAANAPAQTQIMDFDDALKTGAIALFGEKYGDRVRVVTIDENFSVELCGGTHVQRAGDIGLFHFTSESAIAAGIRRVEALTTSAALTHVQKQLARIEDMGALLKVPTNQLEEKCQQLRDQLRGTQKQIDQLRQAQQAQQVNFLAQQAKKSNGFYVLVEQVENADGKLLRQLAVELQARLAPAAVFLAGGEEKAAFAAAVSPACAISAKDWVAQAAAIAGAKGGGKDAFAQAGGGEMNKCEQVLTAAREFIQ